MCNKNFIQINIVDTDNGYNGDHFLDSYIIIIPDDEMINHEEKLNKLQEMLNNRADENNEFYGNFGAIYDYLNENFEILPISTIKEIEW